MKRFHFQRKANASRGENRRGNVAIVCRNFVMKSVDTLRIEFFAAYLFEQRFFSWSTLSTSHDDMHKAQRIMARGGIKSTYEEFF